MAKSINASAKSRGRPVTTGTGTTIGVRMLDGRIASLDAWIAKQKEPGLTRPEAIRRLVELGLKVHTPETKAVKGLRKRVARAAEIAAQGIDSLTVSAADAGEKASRKRRRHTELGLKAKK
jgi:hypothetical protein